ncbi:NAD(P)H nitroreductase [Brevibacillus laterosporus]|nr:nitroreductase [Brevibacillus laterosporus]TPG88306.1 NAD(P)H nitroreductase [Brevibacillus laterosporus]
MAEATQTLATLITSRRSVRQTQNTPLPMESIYEILEQAAYAPFHSEVEPWAVKIASTEQEKKYFFQCVFNSYERIGIFESYTDEKKEKVKESYREYFEGTPVSILVATDVFDHEKKDFESVGATCAFIQNVQLLCWEKNIGAVWRTNPYIFDPEFIKEMGFTSKQKIVGSLHLGYPQQVPKAKERRSLDQWVSRVHVGAEKQLDQQG